MVEHFVFLPRVRDQRVVNFYAKLVKPLIEGFFRWKTLFKNG
jgi:hypothetical protein